MKCLRLDVKQTIITKSTISGTNHFLTGERHSDGTTITPKDADRVIHFHVRRDIIAITINMIFLMQ